MWRRMATRPWRLALGGTLWLVAAGASGLWITRAWDAQAPQGRWARTLWSYATRATSPLRLKLDEPQQVAVGDPLLMMRGGEVVQVGEVSALIENDRVLPARQHKVSVVEVRLYPGVALPTASDRISYHTAETSLAWVVHTLLTEERKAAVVRELEQVLHEHRAEMVEALRPVVEAAVRDALRVVAADLPPAVSRRRAALSRLGERYQQELVERELLPLVEQEIWPIVQQRAEPTIRELGRELWDRVSLWSFTWRAVWDKLPFTDGDLVEREFQRFVKEVVLPLLRRRTPELIEVVRQVLHDVAANKRVRTVAKKSMDKLIDDPELARLLEGIFAEAVVHNPRMHQVLREHWQSPATQQALQRVSAPWEPALRRIGEQLFGTPSQGITPQFAAVLRNQILRKDRRWFLWEPAGTSPGTVGGTVPRGPESAYPVRRWQPGDSAPAAEAAEVNQIATPAPGPASKPE